MKKSRTIALVLMVILMVTVLTVSCDGNTKAPKDKNSETFMDYLMEHFNTVKIYQSKDRNPSSKTKIPEVYVVYQEDVDGLSEAKTKLLLKTLLSGKSVMFVSPSAESMKSVYAKLKERATSVIDNTFVVSYEEMDRRLGTVEILTNEGLYEELDASLNTLPTKYEVIGIKDGEIYYVHDIKSTVCFETSEEEESESTIGDLPLDVTGPKTNPAEAEQYPEEEAAEKFAHWLFTPPYVLGGNAEGSIATQKFYHSFTAGSYDHYAGRKETIEVNIEVTAACALEQSPKMDYYSVHTIITANNDQLGFKNDWDNGKYVGPFMRALTVEQSFKNAPSVQIGNYSPRNAIGSTSQSNTTGFSISGSVGANSTGPMGSIGASYTNTTTRVINIPDITTTVTNVGGEGKMKWEFTTPEVDWGWNGFMDLYTYCNNPKTIQTKMATFDTDAVYGIPSSFTAGRDDGMIPLTTKATIEITYLDGHVSGLNLTVTKKTNIKWCTITDYIRKPNNCSRDYLMAFDQPEGFETEDVVRFNNAMKNYFAQWNDNVPYYDNRESELDNTAKKIFHDVMADVENNSRALKPYMPKDFSGSIRFFIKRTSSPETLEEMTITF